MTDLVSDLFRNFIGFEQYVVPAHEPKFPPYNIRKNGDESYRIELAVAGFKKDELEVSVKDNVLTVSGSLAYMESEPSNIVYRGLALRDFKRSWRLAEYVEVNKVKLEDGILTIDLEQKLPEEAKPKVFDIQ